MGLFLFFFSMAWILLSSSTLSVAKKRSRFCYMEWSLFPYHHYLEVSHSAKAKKEPIEICAVFWILNDSKGTKIFKQNGCGRILIFYLQFKKFLSHLFPTLFVAARSKLYCCPASKMQKYQALTKNLEVWPSRKLRQKDCKKGEE